MKRLIEQLLTQLKHASACAAVLLVIGCLGCSFDWFADMLAAAGGHPDTIAGLRFGARALFYGDIAALLAAAGRAVWATIKSPQL